MLPSRPATYLEDDSSIPTTEMPGKPQAIPAFDDENLDIDLSKALRKGGVVQASGSAARRAKVSSDTANKKSSKSSSKRRRKTADDES